MGDSRHRVLLGVCLAVSLVSIACGGGDETGSGAAAETTDTATESSPQDPTAPSLFAIPTAEALNQALGEPEYWTEVIVIGEGDPLQELFGTLRVQCNGPEFQPVAFEATRFSGVGAGAVADSAMYLIYGFSDPDAAAAAFAAGSSAGECERDNGLSVSRGPEPFALSGGQAIRFVATDSRPAYTEEVWVLRKDTILVVILQGPGSRDRNKIGPYVAEATKEGGADLASEAGNDEPSEEAQEGGEPSGEDSAGS